MLRIHFSAEDLRRIRILGRPDPMWELVLGIHRLHEHSAHEPRTTDEPVLTSPAWKVLSVLVPHRGIFPDFLTPAMARGGFETGLEAIQATPEQRLRAELDRALHQYPSVPGWTNDFVKADRSTRRLLELALREFFREYIRPQWSEVRRRVATDFALRSRDLTSGGVDALLSGLPKHIRWNWPVLEADYPREHHIELGGRGLVLIPSFFCVDRPVSLIDQDLPPVLVYPATGTSTTPVLGPDPHQLAALEDVVGTTRAQILAALDEPCSTNELATRIDRSAASASQHVGLLRSAGLVRSTRHGQHVRHELSEVARRLLGREDHHVLVPQQSAPHRSSGSPAVLGRTPAPGPHHLP